MTLRLDRRLHPLREGKQPLAAAYLQPLLEEIGHQPLPRFVVPRRAVATRTVAITSASTPSVTPSAKNHNAMISELIQGEAFDVYDEQDALAWGQSCHDGYVGFVPRHALTFESTEATHWVHVPHTAVYEAPRGTAAMRQALPMLSQIIVAQHQDQEQHRWAQLKDGGWLPAAHTTPIGQYRPDVIRTALGFLGCPYRWGGRTSHGLDCSALIQVSLAAAGWQSPRDSDQQQRTLGVAATGQRLRGDLLFFREGEGVDQGVDHVGFVLSEDMILHATAFSMQVCTEPLRAVCARAEMCDHRRLSAYPPNR